MAELELIQPLKGGLKKALESCLSGEECDVCLEGNIGEAIVLTDRNAIIVKAGYSSGAMFGSKANTYGYKSISGVEYSTGLMAGRIELQLAGTAQRGSGKFADMRQAENVINFGRDKYEPMKKVAEIIRQRVHDSQNAGTVSQTVPSGADEIRKYKQLLDDGIIDQDEFNRVKAKYLGV